MVKIKVCYKKRKISVNAKKVSLFGKYTGLMFKRRNTKILLFEFESKKRWAIHSYFVFFPFIAIWLDEKNHVVDLKIVRPFIPIIKPKNNFSKLIEIPINDGNSKFARFFVGKGKI